MKKNINLTVISGWGGRISQSFFIFLALSLISRSVGVEEYSYFILLLALNPWLALLDFGLGSSLQTYIPRYKNKNEFYLFKRTVVSFSFVTIVFSIFFLFAVNFFLLKIYSVGLSFYHQYFLLLLLFFSSYMTQIYKYFYVVGKGFYANIIPSFSLLITLCLYIFLPKDDDIFWVSFKYFFPLFILNCLAFFYFFKPKFLLDFGWLKKNKFFSKSLSKYFLFSLLSVLVLQTDTFMIVSFLSGSKLIEYNTMYRVFSLSFLLYSSFLTFYWGRSSYLLHKKKYSELRRNVFLFICLGGGWIVLSALIIYFSSDLIFKILVPSYHYAEDVGLILLFLVYFLIRVVIDTFSVVILSSDDTSIMFKVIPFQAFINFAMQYYFLSHGGGLYSILLSLIFSFLITVCIAFPIKFLKLTRVF